MIFLLHFLNGLTQAGNFLQAIVTTQPDNPPGDFTIPPVVVELRPWYLQSQRRPNSINVRDQRFSVSSTVGQARILPATGNLQSSSCRLTSPLTELTSLELLLTTVLLPLLTTLAGTVADNFTGTVAGNFCCYFGYCGYCCGYCGYCTSKRQVPNPVNVYTPPGHLGVSPCKWALSL